MTTIYGGITAGRACIGRGRVVHLVAASWLVFARKGDRVTAACGRKGHVSDFNPEGELCRDCSRAIS